MTWKVEITGPAQKDLRKLPSADKARVEAALATMRDDPFAGDIVRLKGATDGLASSSRQLPNLL